jgi:hypothetical protein
LRADSAGLYLDYQAGMIKNYSFGIGSTAANAYPLFP